MRRTFTWLWLLVPLLSQAADTVTTKITPDNLGPGEPFRMEITVTSTGDFAGPVLRIASELPVLEFIPLRFSGQRFSSGNTCTLLVSGVAPESPGLHRIPGFTATFSVRKIEIPETRFFVKANEPGVRQGFAKAVLEMPERTFYVGETVQALIHFKHGTSERITGFYGIESRSETIKSRSTVINNPEDNGDPANSLSSENSKIAAIELTPTQAGEIDVRLSGMMFVEMNQSAGQLNRDRPFSFSRKIKVAHVPEKNRPADWNGAVGSLTAGPVSLSNSKPGIGEPINLSVTVTGNANLDRILAPEVPHGDLWDVMPANDKPRAMRKDSQRTFSYTLIPRLPGNLKTPSVRLSFFNPETKTYERIEFAPQDVAVTGRAPEKVELVAIDPAATIGATEKASQRATELLNPDTTAGGTRTRPNLLAQPSTLVWSQLGLLGLLAGALIWSARRDWLHRHPEILRRRTALVALRKARRLSRKAERNGDTDAHAHACVTALRAGAAPLVEATDVALTAEDILRAIPELTTPASVRAIFRRADGTRFGGAMTAETLNLHGDIERCLKQMEERLCA